ncbi:MAG: energy transducer TonB, partial [Flavisolibacter sp.]
MEANKILQADILDLVFEGRNKEYGAYELRKKYNKRIWLALLITAGIVAGAIGASLLANEVLPSSDDVLVEDVTLAQIEEPPPPPDVPPPPPPKAPPPPPVELTKFTPPIIKKDEEVVKQEMPPQEELPETKIAEITQIGDKDLNITIPPVVEESKGTVQGPVFDENEIFQKVEIEAKVDQRQWRRHLESQLQRFIEDAASQGMNPGQYTV